MNRGRGSLYSTVKIKTESEFALPQAILAEDDEQQIILDESSLVYEDYEEGEGEPEEIEGVQQFYQCETGEWMQVDSPSASNPNYPIQFIDSNGTIPFVSGQQFIVDGQEYVPVEEEEEQQFMIDDDAFQQMLASNQFEIVTVPDEVNSGGVEVVGELCGSVLNGPFVTEGGDTYFTFGNPEITGAGTTDKPAADHTFVNAKQYNRILKRREARKKLASRIEPRKKYIHPSRHAHALARKRGEGGKFGAGKPEKTAVHMKQELSNDKYIKK